MDNDEFLKLKKENRRLRHEKKMLEDSRRRRTIVLAAAAAALLLLSIVQSFRACSYESSLSKSSSAAAENQMPNSASENEMKAEEQSAEQTSSEKESITETAKLQPSESELDTQQSQAETEASAAGTFAIETVASAAASAAATEAESTVSTAKKVYLTFDDGPSSYTYEILDILRRYNVKATFFVTKHTEEGSAEKYNKILEEGHSLGIHSVSHEYSTVYASIESFASDVLEIQDYVRSVTGYSPTLYRFPGGSSNYQFKYNVTVHQCVDWLNANGFTYFDWNVSSGDSSYPPLEPGQIAYNILEGPYSVVQRSEPVVVLMHDAADKAATVQALPYVIEQIQAMGYEILPITADTTPLHHDISDR